jgi:hypothetical protein
MPQQIWVLGSEVNTGLTERGNALMDPGPVALVNGSCVGNLVLEMRQGMEQEDLTGTGFTGPVLWMGRYVTNQGVEETWAAANNNGTAVLARKVNNIWSPVAFSDVPTPSNLIYMQAVGMNNKFFLAYDSNVNRLHVWDGTQVRRVGLAPATAPTAPPTGGSGATVTRSYRQRHVAMSGGAVLLRSEPSAVTTVTDKLPITVNRGAVPIDADVVIIAGAAWFWEVEAADKLGGPWYRIATVAIDVLTYVDNNATIPTPNPSDELGSYVPPPSAKFLSTDGLSLLMGGAWEATAQPGETAPKQNRVWYTPPLGSSDIGDDERIVHTLTVNGWLDVGDAGPVTALAGPVYGETFVTKKATVAKLTPTGNVDAPYALSILTNSCGCVDQRLMTQGEVAGQPAILFADSNAVYALTASGGIGCISEPIGVALRGLTIIADPGLLIYDPLERTLYLQTSHSPPSIDGTYRNFMFDTYKRRWEGFALGGSKGGWILGLSKLGIDTILGGGGTEVYNGCYAEQNGERRLYLCGADSAGRSTISSRGGQTVLDIDQPFNATARYRKIFKPGSKATVGCPTVYFCNPMGSSDGVLSLTFTYVRDFVEERSQTVELPPTTYASRIAFGVYTFEGISSADVSVLDVVLTMRYEGHAYASPVTPSVACVVVPYLTSEALAQ